MKYNILKKQDCETEEEFNERYEKHKKLLVDLYNKMTYEKRKSEKVYCNECKVFYDKYYKAHNKSKRHLKNVQQCEEGINIKLI